MRPILIATVLLAFAGPVLGNAVNADTSTAVLDISSVAGIHWQFQPEGGDWSPILVPDGGWKPQGFHCDEGLYRTTVKLPKFDKSDRLMLKFDAVNFGAEVRVGQDYDHTTLVASHIDGWVPVTADITNHVTSEGNAAITVDVKGREKFKLNGKYIVPEGATWCQSIEEGIIRGVHIEVVPAVRVTDVFVEPSVAQKTLTASVTVTNDSATASTVTLKSNLSSFDHASFTYPVLKPVTLEIPAGSSRTVELGPTAWTLGSSSYWWPNVPYKEGYRAHLHVLTIELLTSDEKRQSVATTFGFRDFVAQGPHYYLNGIRCNLRGDNLQEANFGTDAYGVRPGFGPPTSGNAGWPAAVDNLERLNFNVMRLHQIPATPYMLDVADQLGLMLIEESPLRGSEGGEDFQGGHDNMVNMDRELVLRDRNHAATIIWSAANEWGDPIPDCTAAIKSLDPTRPVIADGCGDPGPQYIFMQHYVNGLDACPTSGGAAQTSRPYGEGEAIWPADNTLQGFAWMATGTLQRRLENDADIRNYTLNNAWPNFVPGENPSNEICEKKVKNMGGDMDILPSIADPWSNPNIRLMQSKYCPTAAFDTRFEKSNVLSDKTGEWPVLLPRVSAGSLVTRHIAVFNDEFAGETVNVSWSVRRGSVTSVPVASGSFSLPVPLGEYAEKDISFNAPAEPGQVLLSLSTSKNGVAQASENKIAFQVVSGSADLVPNGVYQVVNVASGTAAEVKGDSKDQQTVVLGYKPSASQGQLWKVDNLGDDYVTLTNVNSGLAMEVYGERTDKDADVDQWPLHGRDNAIWHVEESAPNSFTLTNKHSGLALDLYGGNADDGTRIEQWDVTRGTNQQWYFRQPDSK